MDYGGDDGGGRSRQRKRNSRFKDDEFVQDDVEEEDMEEDDEDMRGPRRGAAGRAPVGMIRKGPVGRPPKGNKTCPSCEEPVKPAATSCEYCDYVFTSATRIKEDSIPVTERFLFEPERVSRVFTHDQARLTLPRCQAPPWVFQCGVPCWMSTREIFKHAR